MRKFQLWIKRLFDITISAMLLVVLSPLLGVTGLLVRISSPGPAIFRQQRAGLAGLCFTIFKFRTMVVGSESTGAGYYMQRNDPRITPLGKFLRQCSIDELPELLNVLKGDMSLVGPRPTLPYQIEMYDEEQRKRLSMKPGITGLAQVSGRNEIPWSKRIELDIQYVQRWSLWMDFDIILKTIFVVLMRSGIRQDQSREQVEDIVRSRSNSMQGRVDK